MTAIVLFVHTWIVLQVAGLTAIADGNRMANRAAAAMKNGQYAAAAREYGRMADELKIKDDAILANLGQAYLRQDDYANATRAYTRLSLSKDPSLRSLAHCQLGVIASRQKNPGEAANQLKEALRQDPNNQLARMNLARLLKRNPKLEPPKNQQNQQNKQDQQKQQDKQNKQDSAQQKQNQQNNQNKDQQKQGQDKKEGTKDGQKQDQKEKEQGNQQGQNNKKAEGQTQQGQEQNKAGAQGNGQNKDDEEGKNSDGKKPKEDINGEVATREQLQKMQMTEARAKQLLEAMRTSEVQYLQQRRHRRNGSKSNSKKDW